MLSPDDASISTASNTDNLYQRVPVRIVHGIKTPRIGLEANAHAFSVKTSRTCPVGRLRGPNSSMAGFVACLGAAIPRSMLVHAKSVAPGTREAPSVARGEQPACRITVHHRVPPGRITPQRPLKTLQRMSVPLRFSKQHAEFVPERSVMRIALHRLLHASQRFLNASARGLNLSQ
jgi:hypothetical protein